MADVEDEDSLPSSQSSGPEPQQPQHQQQQPLHRTPPQRKAIADRNTSPSFSPLVAAAVGPTATTPTATARGNSRASLTTGSVGASSQLADGFSALPPPERRQFLQLVAPQLSDEDWRVLEQLRHADR